MEISVVILAAGQGKRMNSPLPKVLQLIAGKTMLEHVYEKARALTPHTPIVVHGYEGALVKDTMRHHEIKWVEQTEQLGTGHAALQGVSVVPDNHHVLILYGDVPLISVASLKKFITETDEKALGIITAQFPDPMGIGRVLRDMNQKIYGVIEEKDATESQRKMTEVNTGFYFAQASYLKRWLPELNNNNAQQEYYLTDIIAMAAQQCTDVQAMALANYQEALGINDLAQLAEAEKLMTQKAEITE